MRKEIEISFTDRGKELVFLIREMPATKLEKWIMQVILLLGSKTKNLVQQDLDLDLILELVENIEFNQAQALLDELLTCVQRKVDFSLIQVTSQNVDSFIEDVQSLVKLRLEVLKLNFSFLLTESSQTMPQATPQATAQATPQRTSGTQIFSQTEAQAPNSYNMRISAPTKP